MPLQVKRGPTADRILITPVIGELVYDETEKKLYVGDGTTPGGAPASDFSIEDAQDAAASLITTGAHTNINFSYNDIAARIDASIDLTNYNGTINADGLIGSVFANDSTILINAVDGSVNLDGTVKGDIIPDTNIAYDLGSSSFRFRDLYLSGSSINLGAAIITATGSAVNLPAGSTIGGELLNASLLTELSANIIADDSTVIVNTTTKVVTADTVGFHTGDVKGSLFGDDSSTMIDANDHTIYATGGFFGNLTASGNTSGVSNIILGTHVNNAATNDFNFRKSRGTENSPAPVIQFDLLGSVLFQAYDGSTYNTSASMFTTTVGAVSTGIVPSQITFTTTTTAGLRSPRIRITDTGRISIGPIVASDTGSGSLRIAQTVSSNTEPTVNLFNYSDAALGISIAFNASRGTATVPLAAQTNDIMFRLRGRAYDGSGYFTSSQIESVITGTISAGIVPSNLRFGTMNTSGVLVYHTVLENNGLLTHSADLQVDGMITGDLSGSVFLDDSTRIIDGTDGSITAGSFVQFGSLTAGERNALTAVNGMVIYNTTYNRFEGYQNGAWINLDDGTAAGA
jgi:hypothetical protein